mmetsp:Transcript_40396/g.121707  ORF Transcript_40396/g.121707 Transcript_40396/m.121707 type:complete len:278 (+) Transcript_40396:1437-2270(+)
MPGMDLLLQHQGNGAGGPAVASGASDFLEVMLRGGGEAEMYHASNVGLVYAESEGYGGHADTGLAPHELALRPRSRVRVHPAVIEYYAALHVRTVQLLGDRLGVSLTPHIHDDRACSETPWLDGSAVAVVFPLAQGIAVGGGSGAPGVLQYLVQHMSSLVLSDQYLGRDVDVVPVAPQNLDSVDDLPLCREAVTVLGTVLRPSDVIVRVIVICTCAARRPGYPKSPADVPHHLGTRRGRQRQYTPGLDRIDQPSQPQVARSEIVSPLTQAVRLVHAQ